MSTLELLTEARERIAQGWTQKASARDGLGIAVNAHNPQAVSFCAAGALGASPGYDWLTMDALVINALVDALPGPAYSGVNAITDFNDNPDTTKADVLALYDRAIQGVS